jgi:hypothetical protein
MTQRQSAYTAASLEFTERGDFKPRRATPQGSLAP